MSTTKAIPGIQRGPDFDREQYEVAQEERTTREAKMNRQVEANDPLIEAAVSAMQEVAESDNLGRKFDVQYERNSGLIVVKVMNADGTEVIRQVPPDEAIRMAQHLKQQRAQLLSEIF